MTRLKRRASTIVVTGARPKVRATTRAFEAWLRKQVRVDERELRRKHDAMRRSLFEFLRATYYHWATLWPSECADLMDAPIVTAVGDLHVENFGTWRDAEGRLAWGVNDFDEAALLPYTNDLVRLATSAELASREGLLELRPREIFAVLLDGYAAGLRDGGRPVVLAERHRKVGDRIVQCLVEPKRFWAEKLGRDLRARPGVPLNCRTVLEDALPEGAHVLEMRARTAGLGSLGRPRFVAVAEWAGSRVAREAKAFVSSATVWAQGDKAPRPRERYVSYLLRRAARSRDPFLKVSSTWIVRRLAPDSDKIRLEALGDRTLELQLVTLMGTELANVHLATDRSREAILRDLRKRGTHWLRKSTRRMLTCVEADHAEWRHG